LTGFEVFKKYLFTVYQKLKKQVGFWPFFLLTKQPAYLLKR